MQLDVLLQDNLSQSLMQEQKAERVKILSYSRKVA